MYEPRFKLSERLTDNLAKIDEMRTLLDSIPVLNIVEQQIQREALAATVHYTTLIEGNKLDLLTVTRLGSMRIAKAITSSVDEQEVLNLYQVMRFIGPLASQSDIPIDEDVIKQIHTFVVRDIPQQGPPGEYRRRQVAVADQTRKPIFMPPKPSDVPGLVKDFSGWLAQKTLALHPVITAGLAHLELAAIHPFNNGNGRTSRALADMILDRHGYSFRNLFSWVSQVGIDMSIYHSTLGEVLGTEYGANVDPTRWLEYFTSVVTNSLNEIQPELLRRRDYFMEMYNLGEEKGLSKDQVQALVYALTYQEVTTGVYMDAIGVSRATAIKRLNELVKIGYLKIVGKGRSVRYIPTLKKHATDTSAYAAEEIQLRLKMEDN